jgi:hypothetical protein
MDKIHNKLKRKSITELKAHLKSFYKSSNPKLKRCKTKDDFISEIINQHKQHVVTINPNRKLGLLTSAQIRRVATSVDMFKADKENKNKRVKTGDSKEKSVKSVSSKRSNRSKSKRKQPIKRKNVVNSRVGSQAAKSNKSTPVRLHHSSIASEESSVHHAPSEVSQSAVANIEQEVLVSNLGDYNMNQAPEFADAIDGPLTRSKTKEYVMKRLFQTRDEPPRATLDFGAASSESDHNVVQPLKAAFASPLKDRLITPMKAFARSIQHRFENMPLMSRPKKANVDYEVINNAFSLGLVFVSLYIILINIVNKIPTSNYDTTNYSDLHLSTSNSSHNFCEDGWIKVGYLCGSEDDVLYNTELQNVQNHFDTLIYMYNPLEGANGQNIQRNISNIGTYDKIIGNSYFSDRLVLQIRTGTTTARIQLKDGFKVEAPIANFYWYSITSHIETSEYWTTYYLIGYAIVIALTLVSSYVFIFNSSPKYETYSIESPRRSERLAKH